MAPEALRVVAGVDGGGSKTACRVAATDGTLLAEGAAGPSNYQTVGQAGALASLATAIEAAAAGTWGARCTWWGCAWPWPGSTARLIWRPCAASPGPCSNGPYLG